MLRCWNDKEFTTEQAAYGIAFMLIRQLTQFTVIERSRKGTGFDYWLGSEDEAGELPFQNKVRLEVSGLLDTPRDKSTGILGSTKPLNLESLRHLDQRWDSPQALTFRVPLGSCIAEAVRWAAMPTCTPSENPQGSNCRASPVLLETICSKILSRLAPMNLLPTARRKLEQCSRTA